MADPDDAATEQGPYRFHALTASFFVLSEKESEEKTILQRIVQLKGPHISAVLVSPVKDEKNQHRRTLSGRLSLSPTAKRTPCLAPAQPRHRVWFSTQSATQVTATAKQKQDIKKGGLVDDRKKTAPPSGLPHYEYEVVIRFLRRYQSRNPQWGSLLLSDLVFAATAPQPMVDQDIADLLLSPLKRCEQHGRMAMSQAALLHFIRNRYRGMLPANINHEEVTQLIDEYSNDSCRGEVMKGKIFRTWLAEMTPSSPLSTRLQSERCSEPPTHPYPPIRPYTMRWQDWMERHIYNRPQSPRMKPLVLICSQGNIGKTEWARSWGTHVYMHTNVNMPLLHDCLQEGQARYVVIDDVDWVKLLKPGNPAVDVLTNCDAISWYIGKRLVVTKQTLPVMVIKNDLPPPMSRHWGTRGWKYWEDQLEIIQLFPEIKLYDMPDEKDESVEAASTSQPEEADDQEADADAVDHSRVEDDADDAFTFPQQAPQHAGDSDDEDR